ncbi:MAG: alpha/beta fold hydrolase [Polyangiales bacterium]
MTRWRVPALLSVVLGSAACDQADEPLEGQRPAPVLAAESAASAPPGTCAVVVDDEACDRTKRPIVFVHGTVANGESFGHPAQLLASNGYCPDRIRAVEYNSLIMTGPTTGSGLPSRGGDAGAAGVSATLDFEATHRSARAAIDQAIAELRAETGFDKVDIMGHSQGGYHASRYVREHADAIAHYVNFAGGNLTTNPGEVPTLCLSSTGDAPMACGTTRNVVFQDDTLDHAAVSSSTESFVEVYKFLNGDQLPKFDQVQCGSRIVLEGKAPTFGDNQYLAGAKIEVHELGDAPRERGTPVKVFEIGADGKFGPWEAKRDAAYEFKLVPPPGDTRRPRRAYVPGFVRSDRLLRFTFESRDPTAAATGARLGYDDAHAAMVVRRRQKAFLHGRDSLKIDGFEAIGPDNAKNRSVTAALYLYDAPPFDQKSSGGSIIKARFVDSADVFMSAATPRFIDVSFNGRSVRVPNWPSDSEGLSLVLVD